jgi:hypothetical protein
LGEGKVEGIFTRAPSPSPKGEGITASLFDGSRSQRGGAVLRVAVSGI